MFCHGFHGSLTESLAHYWPRDCACMLVKPDHIACYLFTNNPRSYDGINSNREILFYGYRQEHWETLKGRSFKYEEQENRV